MVPKTSLNVQVPPKLPVFFNTYAKFSRDIAMLTYKVAAREATRPFTMGDALAGIGARGVRMAVEVAGVDEVCVNDLNPTSVEYASAIAQLNGVSDKCKFTSLDACQFLINHSSPRERFSIVDIDPFGSPAPYLDCAIRAVKKDGWMAVTATDTPVLCGIYPKVAFRRYCGYSLRTEYCHEVGIRLLLGALAHAGMKIDIGIIPIFSHTTRHYIRSYVKISTGASKAERARQSLGYINHCFACGSRSVDGEAKQRCSACGASVKTGGPLWVDDIYDAAALKELIILSEERYRKLFERAVEESEMPPTYYVPDRISDELQVSSSSPDRVVEALRHEGYRASRTAINPKGVKTDATISVVKDVIQKLSS